MASIDDLSTEYEFDYGSIGTNTLEEIRDRIQIHTGINARYARFKIRDHIRQTQNGWKGAELSSKSTGKCLQKFFKDVLNELKNAMHNLV